jgi:hypothetical protein
MMSWVNLAFLAVALPLAIVSAGFLALVQPVWAIVECALSARRPAGKAVWIVAMVVLYGPATLVYGLFAATGKWMRRLTVASVLVLIAAGLWGAWLFANSVEFHQHFEREWNRGISPRMVEFRDRMVEFRDPLSGIRDL